MNPPSSWQTYPAQPVDDWRHDLDRLPSALAEAGEHAGAGSVIVAADLNSTTNMRPFRVLLRNSTVQCDPSGGPQDVGSVCRQARQCQIV
jgi:hypothetical protein